MLLGPTFTLIRIDPAWSARLPPADLLAALEALDPSVSTRATIFKGPGENLVLAATLCGHELVLKREPCHTLWHRFKAALGLDKHARQWRGGRLLTSGGLHAATPIAIVEHRPQRGSFTGQSRSRWLVLPHLPHQNVLSIIDLNLFGPTQQQRIARAIAADFLTMRRAWLINRDPKPSNILWDAAASRPIWIDTVGVRRSPRHVHNAHYLAWLRSITLLYIEPHGVSERRWPRYHDQHIPPAMPRRTLIARFLREIEPDRTRRLTLWHRLAALVRAHGDPTK